MVTTKGYPISAGPHPHHATNLIQFQMEPRVKYKFFGNIVLSKLKSNAERNRIGCIVLGNLRSQEQIDLIINCFVQFAAVFADHRRPCKSTSRFIIFYCLS